MTSCAGRQYLLSLPLPAMQLLLSSDGLKVSKAAFEAPRLFLHFIFFS
jgi:hypothetical protein